MRALHHKSGKKLIRFFSDSGSLANGADAFGAQHDIHLGTVDHEMGTVKIWLADVRDTILGVRHQVTEIRDFVTVVAHVHKVVIVPDEGGEEKGCGVLSPRLDSIC